VGPRTGLDGVGKRKPLVPAGTQTQIPQPSSYTDCGIPAFVLEIILTEEGTFIARALTKTHVHQFNLSEV
jgi:hypothetical protein